MAAEPPPPPLEVRYAAWKISAMALVVAFLSGAWTWRGFQALSTATEPGLRLWAMPLLGAVMTAAILAGGWVVWRGTSRVLLIDRHGIQAADLYDDLVPWSAISGVTRVRGRGVVVRIADGARFGRRMTRNVRSGTRPGAPDLAAIRSGLLDHSAAAILASIEAHLADRDRRG